MTSPAAVDIAGRLHVRPGAALPTIRSTRREWAPRLGRGLPAQQLPALLASVYTLCGGAHRLAASHAVQAARRDDAGITHAQRQLLQADTLREHLRRLWLDAPRLAPGLPAPDPAELAACPLLQRGDANTAGAADTRSWIEQRVLGGPAAAWCEGWSADPKAFVLHWAASTVTWPARWLQSVLHACGSQKQAVVPLLAQASSIELRRVARQLRHEPDFALAPTWRGHTAETGCWTRMNDVHARGHVHPCAELGLRHAARLADIARLLAPGSEHWLAQGQLSLDDTTDGDTRPAAPAREGLGWCEMARGLLLHWVRLDAQDHVLDCRLVAPTEWNFHPFGSAARALADLPAAADDSRLRALVGAYDPCVTVTRDSDGDGVGKDRDA